MTLHDVLIIGAGVTGMSIARELSRYKLKIMVVEKEAEPAFGISKSNSGIIHAGTQNPPDSLKGRLCVEGNRLMRICAKELGVDFKPVGALITAFSDPECSRLDFIQSQAQALGVPGVKRVDHAWLQQHEPNLNPAIVAALVTPTAGILSPYRLVYALAENAMKNGVEIKTLCRVVGIVSQSDHFRVQTESGQTLASRFVVNAAGLYADDVARLAGVQDIVIRPRKGEEFLLDKKREHLTQHLIFPLPTAVSKGILVIKTADGNPMIGPTAQEVEDKNDLSTSAAGVEDVLTQARQLVPSINGRDIIAYFAGLRAVAGEDFIIRPENALPGFIQVAGIQSPGLTAAPAIAQRVKQLLQHAGLTLQRKFFFQRHRPASTHLYALPWRKIKQLIKRHPAYGDVVCRCEMVSAQEIRDAIHRGARTLDGIKFRTRAQAGRCHGGFCTTRIITLLAQELNLPPTAVTKRGPGTELIPGEKS